MDQVKRMQLIAEIKINNPTNFRQVPFDVLKGEILRNQEEFYQEPGQYNGFAHDLEDIKKYKDLIYLLIDYGFDENDANELIFDILVKTNE